ncbi:STAS domain-containing protein [Micromonospora sp. BQ11]|uniref:STAS domain-containing protein n=1 Tax=Micromonospora sp. BQ11 TaxID=3452212 RepID=UPI003F89A84A
MTEPSWTHQVRIERDRTVLLLGGEIDINGASGLQQLLDTTIAAAPRVDVDLLAVDFIDSTVISALITARNTARQARKSFAVVNPASNVARTLRVTGVLDALSPTDA